MRYSEWTINISKIGEKAECTSAYPMKRLAVIADGINPSCRYGNSIHHQMALEN